MAEHSKQRIDADNNFLRIQTKALVRDRIMSESESVAHMRDTNTARLKQQRLDKEAADRTAALTAPPSKSRKKPTRA